MFVVIDWVGRAAASYTLSVCLRQLICADSRRNHNRSGTDTA